MKKILLIILSLAFICGFAAVALAAKESKGLYDAKTGDVVYVCGCGDSCECGTLSHKEGTCGCGQKLVKTTITKVDKGRVYYQLNNKEMSASQTGKFACGCGGGCDCGTVSQKEGTCGCGSKLKKVPKR